MVATNIQTLNTVCNELLYAFIINFHHQSI